MVDYDVPFYSNTADDTHCFQAAIRMILKYFEPKKECSWKELEEHTAKAEGLWTWTMAGLLWLKQDGFEVINIEPFDYLRFSEEGGKYLIELWGKDVGEAQLKHSDIPQELIFAKQFAQFSEQRIPAIEEIKKFLTDGYLVICNVNSRALNGEVGYVGHFVVLKGFDESSFIIHDPGLPALENRRVTFEIFEKAWAYPNEMAKNIMAIKLTT